MTPLDIYASYVPGDWPETWDEDDNQGRTYGEYSGKDNQAGRCACNKFKGCGKVEGRKALADQARPSAEPKGQAEGRTQQAG